MRKKLKNSGGFSFVEMLCAVAILVLLCLMMNTGINMAVKSYRDITAESEVELLVSTLSDALADKLRYCVVTENAGTPPTYTLSIGEAEVSGEPVDADAPPKGVVLVDNKRLLPDGAYGATGQFAAGYIGKYTVEAPSGKIVTYNSGDNTFEVKFTVTAEKSSITQTAEFTVRCLNPAKKEG